jgi:hypothetical protein
MLPHVYSGGDCTDLADETRNRSLEADKRLIPHQLHHLDGSCQGKLGSIGSMGLVRGLLGQEFGLR